MNTGAVACTRCGNLIKAGLICICCQSLLLHSFTETRRESTYRRDLPQQRAQELTLLRELSPRAG